jgi:hypothetical protein
MANEFRQNNVAHFLLSLSTDDGDTQKKTTTTTTTTTTGKEKW